MTTTELADMSRAELEQQVIVLYNKCRSLEKFWNITIEQKHDMEDTIAQQIKEMQSKLQTIMHRLETNEWGRIGGK